jgi:zinc protease
VKTLAGRYLKPTAMTYVIVGDAATQAKRMEALGFGAPILINSELKRVQE